MGGRCRIITAGFFSCALTAQQVVMNLYLDAQGNPHYSTSAQCGAFALLLESALAMNRIHSNWVSVFATTRDAPEAAPTGVNMVIKNWDASAPSEPSNQSPWLYHLVLNVGDLMMPPLSSYGDLINQAGIPGQGEPPPGTPLEKVFIAHFIVQVVGATAGCTDYNTLAHSQLFDPSYGVTYSPAGFTYTTQEGFELQAVYGYAARIPLYGDGSDHPNDWHLFRPIATSLNISFQCVPGNSM
jgi:hypothetical protein